MDTIKKGRGPSFYQTTKRKERKVSLVETITAATLTTGKGSVFLASGLGAFFGMIFAENLTSLKQRSAAFLSATVCSMYLSPALIFISNTADTPLEGAISFFCGLMGIGIVSGAVKLSQVFSKDPVGTIKKLFNKTDGCK